MKKKLSEMTLEELWQLFPIQLVDHRIEFKSQYEEEKEALEQNLPKAYIARLNHIGSSAVPGLMSKNTVDILLEVPSNSCVEEVGAMLTQIGWGVMSSKKGDSPEMALNKGYTEDGYAEKVFHLHLRVIGDSSELYFRDYLLEHPSVAKAYEVLKIELAKAFQYDRDEYTRQKTDFIKQHTEAARTLYKDRYKINL